MDTRKPAVIIGNSDSIFPRNLAAYWRSLGLEVVIVTGGSSNTPAILPDGTRIVAAESLCPQEIREQITVLGPLLLSLESEERSVWGERLKSAMRDWGETGYEPSIIPAINNALTIPNAVRSLDPMFVFGQEAFSYGLATALCRGMPRLLMPWGGDIYLFAETNPIAFAMVKSALHAVDLVVPTAAASSRHLSERFSLPQSRIRVISWGVDRNQFRRANTDQRKLICNRYGIDPDATICTNVRRFRPAWGAEDALRTFLKLAQTDRRYHFIMLGGQGTEFYVDQAEKRVLELGLQDRLTLFRGDVPITEYADLMSVTDVFVSLMLVPDMRSLSILQASSAGAVPVLSDQPEYREMERLGFRALFVDPSNDKTVVQAIQTWASNPELRLKVARANHEYLDQHENFSTQMRNLLDLVDIVSLSYACGRSIPQVERPVAIPSATELSYLASSAGGGEPSATDGIRSDAGLESQLRPSNKVLLIRSCRTPEYEQAVLRIRQIDPKAEIWGMAQPEFLKDILSCGVQQVLVYPRRRFGMFRAPLSVIRRIRRLRFDAVAIPYMYLDDGVYANVHRMALLSGAQRYLVLEPDGIVRSYQRQEFRRFVVLRPFARLQRRLDIPLLFGALLAALLMKWFGGSRKPRSGRKRVLHIINSLGLGGAQTQMAELLNRTPNDRYETEVLVLCRSEGDFSRTRIHRPDISIRYLKSWPCLFPSLLEIIRICRTGHYDVVHTWLFLPNVLGAAGARIARCPRVILSIRSLSPRHYPWLCLPWYRQADMFAARIADEITINAGPLVQDHASWTCIPCRRIRIVHNGLDAEGMSVSIKEAMSWTRGQLRLPEDALLIGTAGRLAAEKNQECFLELVRLLRQGFPALHGVIVGDGELRQALSELADELGLGDCIHFTGQTAEARRFIAGLDLFLLPSRIEGFPNVLLEAAFLGVPCIATDVGAAREILGDAGLLFRPGDVKTACRHASLCLTDLEASRRTALKIQARVQNAFSSERMVSHWLSLYDGDTFQGVKSGETGSDPVALLH